MLAGVRRSFADRERDGCSSIYGGNLPTAPYTTNSDGLVSLVNSLFEETPDSVWLSSGLDAHLQGRPWFGSDLRLNWAQPGFRAVGCRPGWRSWHHFTTQASKSFAREVGEFGLCRSATSRCAHDYLVKKSVWPVGGDGWAYDIGYGGRSCSDRRNINILVIPKSIQYGQPGVKGHAARSHANCRRRPIGKKDLGLLASSSHRDSAVAFGAKMVQTAGFPQLNLGGRR